MFLVLFSMLTIKILGDQYYYSHFTDEKVEADTLPSFLQLVHNSHDLNAASVAACNTVFLTAMILYGFTLMKDMRSSKLEIRLHFTS